MKTSRLPDSGGYKPLRLPAKGEDLEPGRQYALTPISRLVIEEMYGLKGVPTFVTCIHCRVAATRVTRIIENLETGHKTETVTIVEPQAATFSAFLSLKNRLKFTLDLERVRQAEAFYADSPKLTKYEQSDELNQGVKAGGTNVPKTRKLPDLSVLD